MRPALVVLALCASSLASAQPKKLVNAAVDSRSADSGLAAQFAAAKSADPQPAWIGWTVPAARTRQFGCDGWQQGVMHLEPPAEVLILIRINNRQVTRILALAPDCEIDGGDAPLHWFNDVKPAESVAVLSGLGEAATTAIARHADAAADALLENWATAHRREAVYNLAAARGKRGIAAVQKLLAAGLTESLRERAVSGLGRNEEAEVAPLLVKLSREDASARVRAQALEALGRRDPARALPELRTALEANSPREVRRRAVSTLRSLPDGAGVPLLIETAKGAKDAELRQHAMNALAQTHDARATAFFEGLLK